MCSSTSSHSDTKSRDMTRPWHSHRSHLRDSRFGCRISTGATSPRGRHCLQCTGLAPAWPRKEITPPRTPSSPALPLLLGFWWTQEAKTPSHDPSSRPWEARPQPSLLAVAVTRETTPRPQAPPPPKPGRIRGWAGLAGVVDVEKSWVDKLPLTPVSSTECRERKGGPCQSNRQARAPPQLASHDSKT